MAALLKLVFFFLWAAFFDAEAQKVQLLFHLGPPNSEDQRERAGPHFGNQTVCRSWCGALDAT